MNDKVKLFEQISIPKAVTTLAIPTIITSLVMVLYNLVDTFFVGMLNDPVQNAAVTLAGPVLLAFNAVNNLFGVGSSSMMSRALGRKDEDTVYRSSAFGIYCSVMAGILFSVLCTVFRNPLLNLLGAEENTAAATAQYLLWTVNCGAMPAILNVVMAYMVRAEGAALHASIGTMSGCILNMVLDPVFILPWGLNMGAAGAGLATFISNCISCLYFMILLYIKRGNTYVCVNPKKFSFRPDIVKGVVGVGVPASIQNLLNVTGMTILNNFTAAYGADAVAAMGITHKVTMIPMQIAFGFYQGIMPLVSYTYAAKLFRRMKDAILCAVKIIVPVLLSVTVIYWLSAGWLIQLFMDNEIIIAYGTRFLRANCLCIPLLAVDFLAVSVFQALGQGRSALIFAILRKIILEIPALIILNKICPLYGLPYAQPAAEAVLAVAAAVMLRRIFIRYETPTSNT